MFLLQLLLTEFLFDVQAERNGAFCFLANHSVVAAEGNELFADWAATVGLLLALFGVGHHPLHLQAFLQVAVGVPALARVDQALTAPLNAQLPWSF